MFLLDITTCQPLDENLGLYMTRGYKNGSVKPKVVSIKNEIFASFALNRAKTAV